MAEYVLAKISKSILYVCGWQPFEISEEQKRLIKSGRYVVAISHTSIWDALIFLAYKYAYPDILSHALIVVKPEIYEACPVWVQNILDDIGFWKATSYDVKNGGFVASTCNQLQNKSKFLFLISPKGARENYPWRSGYYAIAKELNCDIVAAGLDYELKKLTFMDPVSIQNRTREEVEIILKEQMGSIVPLYPKNSEVKLRSFHMSRINIIASSILVIIFVLLLVYLYYYNKLYLLGFVVIFLILI